MLVATALAACLAIFQGSPAARPPISWRSPESDAFLDSPSVRFAGFDLRTSPVGVKLRIVNPTDVLIDLGFDECPMEADGSRQPQIMVEVFRDGVWQWRRYSNADAFVPRLYLRPQTSAVIETSAPPVEERMRFGVWMRIGGRPTRTWTDTIEPPAAFELCTEATTDRPRIDFIAIREDIESTNAVFRLVNPTARYLGVTGRRTDDPAYEIEYELAGGRVENGPAGCGVGIDTIDLPPHRATTFSVWLFDRREPLRVRLVVDGEDLWSPRIIPPPLCRPLTPGEHPESEPSVGFVKLSDPFDSTALVWFEIVNPTAQVLTIPAEYATVPAYRVEVWDEGRFEDREIVWTRKTGYRASELPARRMEIAMPPRTRQYFSVMAYGTREPMRVGIPSRRGNSPEQMLWSGRVDVPPIHDEGVRER